MAVDAEDAPPYPGINQVLKKMTLQRSCSPKSLKLIIQSKILPMPFFVVVVGALHLAIMVMISLHIVNHLKAIVNHM
jgi:hypothetical protein